MKSSLNFLRVLLLTNVLLFSSWKNVGAWQLQHRCYDYTHSPSVPSYQPLQLPVQTLTRNKILGCRCWCALIKKKKNKLCYLGFYRENGAAFTMNNNYCADDRNDTNNNQIDDEIEELWNVGNVKEDFANLERAIMYSNSEQNLYHEERLEALDHFAQQRIPVAPFIRRQIINPLLISILVSKLLQGMIQYNIDMPSSAIHFPAILCRRMIQLVTMIQFWTMIVCVPTMFFGYLLLQRKRITISKATQRVHALQLDNDSDNDYYNLRYLIKNSYSTRDYVKSILEQWLSCVVGMSISGIFWCLCYSLKSGTIKILLSTILCAQIITRLGVMASIQQYQSLWFALIRKQQPQPLQWKVWFMRYITTIASSTHFLVTDMISLLLLVPKMHQIFTPITVSIVLIWWAIVSSENMINNSSDEAVQRHLYAESIKNQVKYTTRISVNALALSLLWYCGQFVFLNNSLSKNAMVAFRIQCSHLVSLCSLMVAILGPVCHIFAALNLLNLAYIHNASLAMHPDEFSNVIKTKQGESCWRWRRLLKWREPQRVHETIRQWWNGFWYLVLIRGSVDEKLRQDKVRRIMETGAKARGLTVLQKIAAEQRPSISPDRTQWKANAMKRLAEKHQRDYELGSFNDPLGVALYRTLGIGLGFNFDHMQKLHNRKAPSIRRLQARAAKSAIRRVNEIYDVERTRDELDLIKDQNERAERALFLRESAESEVKYLADQLTNLVPTDLSFDESETDLKIEQYRAGSIMRSTGQRFKLPSLQTESPALRKLFDDYNAKKDSKLQSYEINYLDPMGTNDFSTDDEFISEWKRRNTGENNDKFDRIDDEEDRVETLLA